MLLRPDTSPQKTNSSRSMPMRRLQKIKYTIRHVRSTKGAEGANLEQANPDESLRQKDPVSESTLENPPQKFTARDTDGVKF